MPGLQLLRRQLSTIVLLGIWFWFLKGIPRGRTGWQGPGIFLSLLPHDKMTMDNVMVRHTGVLKGYSLCLQEVLTGNDVSDLGYPQYL